MRLRSVPILAGLLAILGASGCQNESGRAVAGQPARPSLNPPGAESASATESDNKAGPATKAATADGPRDYASRKRAPQEIRLMAHPTTVAPVIDGRADDAVWKAAPAITTLDFSSQRPITLKSVVTATDIFFLVTYAKDKPA